MSNQSVDYNETSWACVKDNVTGLVREVKTTIDDIHNKDNAYKWGGLTAKGRVPTILEFLSIVNKGTVSPAIDANYFPNTVSLL